MMAAILVGTAFAHAAAKPPAAPNYADLSLEQLMDLKVERVYGVSRHEQKVTQAPSSVSIVTADDFQRFGWRTLSDMLRSVRGFYTSDDRNYSYLGVRGLLRPGDYNTRMLILVDGHRLNDSIYDGGYIGREQMVSTAVIDRVEVIRGPSSSLYGSSAFFGVINVVTKRASEGGSVSTEVGNYGSFETQLSYGRTFRNGVEWQVSGSHYTSEGEDRLYFPEFDPRRTDNPAASNNGVAVDSDGERSAQLFSSLRYRDLTLAAFVSRRGKEVPTASFESAFNYRGESTFDRRGYVDLKFDRSMGDHRLVARLYYDQYRYNGNYPYDYAAPDEPRDVRVSTDVSVGETVGTELQFNSQLSANHTVVFGGEFRDNFRADQIQYVEGDAVTDDHRATRNLGLYAQWEATLRKDLRLNAGGRYDRYFGSYGGTLSPRLGVIYDLNAVTTVKLLHGTAFRAPNPYERFYYEEQWRHPVLEPEEIRTSEAVLERYWGSVYRSHVSFYYYDVEKLVTQRATDTGDLYFENADSTQAYGAEVELEAKYESGWQARASYAWQSPKDAFTDQRLSSSPRSLAKLNVAWAPASRRFSAGVEVQHQSSVLTLRNAKADSFTLANLHLASAKLWDPYEVALTVSNLFDTRYAMPGAEDHVQDTLPQGRRMLCLKVSRRF